MNALNLMGFIGRLLRYVKEEDTCDMRRRIHVIGRLLRYVKEEDTCDMRRRIHVIGRLLRFVKEDTPSARQIKYCSSLSVRKIKYCCTFGM